MNVAAGRLDCIEHHTFLTGPLVPGSVVIDAGANIGGFASALVAQYPCRVLALEPHPRFFERIPKHERIDKLFCALGGTDGRRRLQLDANPQAARLNDAEQGDGTLTDVRRLESIIRENEIQDLALVKLDIEGTELEVLESLTDDVLDRIAQITIEFHDFAGYCTSEQVEALLSQFERRGWTAVKFSNKFYGDTLLVNRRQIHLSGLAAWRLRHVSRNARGAVRWVRRHIGR